MSCCGDRACSHAVVAAAKAEATRLTDREREIILDVLGRDELLRRDQHLQVLHLKAELQTLRRKGALKPSADRDSAGAGPDPGRACGRCRAGLGRVVNRGACCQACRLRVCKACREYAFGTADWVCTVCHKHMEIQATSGEWMNEFVRRPSRRRENLPAADIIKRTIRRSWTISNPTPRWTALRCSPELRPYNSLPRGQGVTDYPSLALHQTNLVNQQLSLKSESSPIQRRISPSRRTQSEDVYSATHEATPASLEEPQPEATPQVSPRRLERVNPLMRLADQKQGKDGRKAQKRSRQLNEGSSEEGSSREDERTRDTLTPELPSKFDRLASEKRVSFDSNIANSTKINQMKRSPVNVLRTQSLKENSTKETGSFPSYQGDHSDNSEETGSTNELQYAREETAPAPDPVELCDIEPISGTVFRKVTVRRRRQDEGRKISSSEGGWRRGQDDDLLLPDGEDYKLVFINPSDGSSKDDTSSSKGEETSSSREEDEDDDSTSTASSFPLDEGDWDYFEPGAAGRAQSLAGWAASPIGSPGVGRRAVIESPIGSPIVYRRRLRESDTGTDDDNPRLDTGSPASSDSLYLPPPALQPPEPALRCSHDLQPTPSPLAACRHCGAPARFIPVPVPVPVPFPVWGSARTVPRNHLWPFLALIWRGGRSQNTGASGSGTMPEREARAAVNDPAVPEAEAAAAERELSGYLECENAGASSSESSDAAGDWEPRIVSRAYTVNAGRQSDDALPTSEDDVSDSVSLRDETSSSGSAETDTDDTGTVADQKTKRFSRVFVVNKNNSSSSSSDEDTDTELDCTVVLKNIKPLDEDAVNESASSSPALSDVSAQSLGETSEAEPRALSESPRNELVVGETVPRPLAERRDLEEGESERHTGACDDRDDCALLDGRESLSRHGARYTSLVMITQEPTASAVSAGEYQQVSVVTSDTTTLVPDNDVIVRHTNWQEEQKEGGAEGEANDNQNYDVESVTVITGGETLSAFEEGLADDDSWVENLSNEDDDEDFPSNSSENTSSSGDEVTLTCSAAIDQEEDLRGYHRTAIDFTLHTIVEESCEESEVEQKDRPISTTDLEKYFFFGLGDGNTHSSNKEDAFSETSSIYSEGMDSLGGPEETLQYNDNPDPAELASSRLEKYFLSGFMGFTAERRDSDGSVGSDSEGRPSPEQRRKRLVRARGTGRSHSSSLDNLDNAGNDQTSEAQINSEDSSSSESEGHDEANSFEKSDGQFDTVKRKKGKKQKTSSPMAEETKNLDATQELDENESDEDGHKTPQPEISTTPSNLTTTTNQQSRDSGFIGSCDDLIKEQRDNSTPELPSTKNELKLELEDITEERKIEEKIIPLSTPPATSLTRKDSFNNWSSDEETNLMMCKMRQFFKTMVANSQLNASSKPITPNLNLRVSPKPVPSPRAKRCKPPQLVYFENELTRLMKTVPGIRDDQVREIVEYLSSEDTWSDSYDSSDYTSSDLEVTTSKSVLQQQISDSCKQIINKFDTSVDDEGDEGDGGIIDEIHGLNKETAFVYQKLVASFEKMATGDQEDTSIPKLTPHSSPPLIAKVMHHIGSRLVALMHEVSSGESHPSTSPRTKHYHRRLQHKISSASSTTTEDDFPESNNDTIADHLAPYLLPRSRSHDLLTGESRILQQGGVSDNVEEREASDCERFSWRGSFESALLAADSRNKLSLLGHEGASASAMAIAAKRRSAGDLLFSHKSLSREQLDRVRSCGSIGGASSEDKLWIARPNRRRSSVPDASCGSGADDEDEDMENRSTLPRSLQSGAVTTNSLPRLPTNACANVMQKSQSMQGFLPQNVKSARYRPPGFCRLTQVPKRAVSAPGLQPSHQRRGRRSLQASNVPSDETAPLSEAHSSPMLATRGGAGGKSAAPSPGTVTSGGGREWQQDEDIDRLVGLHARTSLSSLGCRSDSMASVYSGAGEGRYGTVAVRGQIEFGLQYNYKAGALEIQIKQCKDLAPVDAKRNRSDPYVKVYLLPDKSKSGKRKTKVKKHTLNPLFDECLKFHVPLDGLESRTLWLTVWHSDMFGRNDFLGEVMMALEDKVFDDPTPKCYNLQERTEPFEDVPTYKGDVLVCLKFVPPDMTVQKKGKRSRGALHVLVKEAKSLTPVKAHGTSDPFCKSYLLPDKGRNSKQKTPVVRKTVNPVWNYKFVYEDVTLQELAERCLELTVWDHDRLASNEFLGGVRFSLGTGKHYGKSVDWMDATGRELSLWRNMLERPNFWVEGCLPLRPSLDTRIS
ncbi:unnamed protein product [Phaedon cochleariae]|uniref:Synaptotagmin-like protein 5 n=1 Tax=Phaedon cochleariae TaxID=80249 RepID=A0A9P0DH38_PHACE|nr:unnamed protein product [Phaedon cochleariae]